MKTIFPSSWEEWVAVFVFSAVIFGMGCFTGSTIQQIKSAPEAIVAKY